MVLKSILTHSLSPRKTGYAKSYVLLEGWQNLVYKPVFVIVFIRISMITSIYISCSILLYFIYHMLHRGIGYKTSHGPLEGAKPSMYISLLAGGHGQNAYLNA